MADAATTGYANAKGTRSTTRKVLTYKEQRLVDAWVKEHYTKEGLDDTKSAENCSKDLQMAISFSHIKFFREVNDIPSNYGKAKLLAKSNEIEMLQVQIDSLNDRLGKLANDVSAFALAMKYNSGPHNIGVKLAKVE
jgi:hypothetical protein